MVFSLKSFLSFFSLTGLVGFTSLIPLDSAHGYAVDLQNPGFEDPINFNDNLGWEGVGDISLQGTYSTIAPSPVTVDNTLQGVITNACPGTAQTGECLNNRNDDSTTTLGQFNNSGNDLISASVEAPNNLQSILGLSNNAFSLPREIDGTRFDGTNNTSLITRTPKEGSALYQDITITDDASSINNFTLDFHWNFLTNDGATDLGDQDFAFVSITGNGLEEIYVLEDSTGPLPVVAPEATDLANLTSPYAAYVSEELALSPGTYRVGFGVVDVDGTARSSALLVDNLAVREVPWDFSPSSALFWLSALFGFHFFRSRLSREQN